MRYKTIRIKTCQGEMIIYKTILEFYFGKKFLSLILEVDKNIISKFYLLQDLLSLELKTRTQEFKKMNIKKYSK